jgi:hypothetical protein
LLALHANHPKTSNPVSSDSTIVVNYDTIPETRKTVKTTAVAEFSERVGGDNLNDWKLGVQVYETKKYLSFFSKSPV